MSMDYSISINECDESACATCNMCEKGKLFEGDENDAFDSAKASVSSAILLDFSDRTYGAYLIDAHSSEPQSVITALNPHDESLVERATASVEKLCENSSPKLVIIAGEYADCNRFLGVHELCGISLLRIPTLSKQTGTLLFSAIVCNESGNDNVLRLYICPGSHTSVCVAYGGKILVKTIDTEIFSDKLVGTNYIKLLAQGADFSKSEELRRTIDNINEVCRVNLSKLDKDIDDIEKVYFIGAFAHFCDMNAAVKTGLIPNITRDNIEVIGNPGIEHCVRYAKYTSTEFADNIKMIDRIEVLE